MRARQKGGANLNGGYGIRFRNVVDIIDQSLDHLTTPIFGRTF